MPKIVFSQALPSKTQKTFLKYPTITKKLSKINIDRPTAKNRATMEMMKAEIAASELSPTDKETLYTASSYLEKLLYWGWGTNRNLLSALVLAGAAIARTDITLRPDLAPSLTEARAAYAAYKAPSVPTGTPGLVTKGLKKSISPFVLELAEGYTRLTAHMAPGGKLDTAIKKLLEDKSRPLRVGTAFRTLDVPKLNKARSEHFLAEQRALATRSWLGDRHSEERLAYAHSSTSLKALDFKCISTQEGGDDQIFWTCLYMSMANLEEIYAIIDKALLDGTIETVNLPVQWKIQGWKSELFTEINAESPIQQLNIPLGQANIYKGFCPWTAVLACVEDDDEEYEAVGEVCDQVGDFAEVVSQGASTVAAVSGPSFLGVAAAAVASAAALVDLCADIVGAVVDIINFFDNDDTIGFVYASGAGDYILDAPPTVDPEGLDVQKLRASSSSSDGAYWIQVQEVLSGSEAPFQRAWRYRSWNAFGEEIAHDPFGFWGGDGDDDVEFYTGVKADRILPGSLIPHEPRNPKDAAHAEWKSEPELMPGHVKVKGTVHWGVRGENSITYTPQTMVMSFTRPEDEKFVVEG